jgi:hypothetical protein
MPFKRDLKGHGALFCVPLYPTPCRALKIAMARYFWRREKMGDLGKTPRKKILGFFEVTTHLLAIYFFNRPSKYSLTYSCRFDYIT